MRLRAALCLLVACGGDSRHGSEWQARELPTVPTAGQSALRASVALPPDRDAATAELDSTAPLPADPHAGKKRIYSVGQTTWIRKKLAVKESDYLGYVRTGSSIPLRSEVRLKGQGCAGGFYQVEPRGYVCADRTVSEAPREGFRDAALATQGVPGAFPYGYALSNHTPMYNRIPTAREQERYEKLLGKPGTHMKMPKTLQSHEELATSDAITANGEIPAFLLDGKSPKEDPYDLVEQTLPLGAMVSYSKVFTANGRNWLLSSDHTIVPADRVRPFKPSRFHGVDLTKGEVKLPIAWMRVSEKPKYKKAEGGVTKTSESFAVRSFVSLTGKKIEANGSSYLETAERDGGAPLYLKESDATVVEAESKIPMGVKEGQKWIQIRLTLGTLVAYKGLTPEYATLVSPGAGGVPVKGRDPVKDSTTPLGAYSITFKDKAATMSPETGKNRSFWIQDVPHTQYFDPPFALHAAFWHERFGEYVSAGCVNLSPTDAEIIFDWTDPPVPKEWQGATGAGASENGPTTIVVIRR